jgi:aminobenzoyl-glutamate transport protein
MFMMLGYQPAFTQLAMRVGLCAFVPISPINPFVPAAVKTGQDYVPDLTYGQFLSIMVPYVVSFMLAWPVLYFVFYAFNLPIGPGITPRF